MPLIYEIEQALYAFAPKELAEPYDNTGLLIGDPRGEAKRALVALDAAGAVIDEAVSLGADVVVTHHPVIFDPLKSVLAGTVESGRVYRLISSGVAVISMHTNLDRTAGGVNDALAAAIGLTGVQKSAGGAGFLRVGTLPAQISPDAFARHLRDTLGGAPVQYASIGRAVRRVAVSSGGGGDDVAEAEAAGADAFVTGELKHHIFLEAPARNMSLFSAGHHHSEAPVLPVLAKVLREAFPSLEVILTKTESPYRPISLQ